MPRERVPQAKGLLIRVDCSSSRRDEEWVAECPAFALFAHGATLPIARKHLLTGLDLFLTDCAERGTLEEVLRVRQVPHAWIETSLLASLDPAAGIRFLTALTGDRDKPADYPTEQLDVIVPALAQGKLHELVKFRD